MASPAPAVSDVAFECFWLIRVDVDFLEVVWLQSKLSKVSRESPDGGIRLKPPSGVFVSVTQGRPGRGRTVSAW